MVDAAAALSFGRHHLDDLAAPCDEIGEEPGRGVRQGPDLGPGGAGELGDDGGVDPVGLGVPLGRLGVGPDLRRIDDHERQAGAGKPRRHDGLEAAGGFDRDDLGLEGGEAQGELLDAGAGAGHGEGLLDREQVNVELVFRDVDAGDDGVHPVPSLSKRASRAAQATVRVRWNGGRRPLLPHGLDHPKGLGPAPATAPASIADEAIRDLQGGPPKAVEGAGPSAGAWDRPLHHASHGPPPPLRGGGLTR